MCSVSSAVRGLVRILSYFFFFQAEDGIRDLTVTGVQTCALPISGGLVVGLAVHLVRVELALGQAGFGAGQGRDAAWHVPAVGRGVGLALRRGVRSEERRVGKECRSRWSPYH